MISENLSASCGATRCHITCVSEKPCKRSSGGPLPPVRAKMRPAEVLIHSAPKPGKRSARSGMMYLLQQQRLLLQTLFALPPARHSFMPSAQPHQQAVIGSAMSIVFEIPTEAKAIREKVRKWLHDECIPAEKELDSKPLADVLGPLRKKARA